MLTTRLSGHFGYAHTIDWSANKVCFFEALPKTTFCYPSSSKEKIKQNDRSKLEEAREGRGEVRGTPGGEKEERVWTKMSFEWEKNWARKRGVCLLRLLWKEAISNEVSLLWQKPFCVQSLGFLALSGHLYPVNEGLSHKSSVLLLLNNLSGAFVFLTHCNWGTRLF